MADLNSSDSAQGDTTADSIVLDTYDELYIHHADAA